MKDDSMLRMHAASLASNQCHGDVTRFNNLANAIYTFLSAKAPTPAPAPKKKVTRKRAAPKKGVPLPGPVTPPFPKRYVDMSRR